jgi:hypothetical protein
MKVIPQFFAAIAFFTCVQGVLFSASKPIGQRIADAYKSTPGHAKKAALGIPLLTLGLILQSSYGGRPGEISDQIRKVKSRLGRGNNKLLKRTLRKLRFQYGGHIALQVLAAIASLAGGSLTVSAVFDWWHARKAREAAPVDGLLVFAHGVNEPVAVRNASETHGGVVHRGSIRVATPDASQRFAGGSGRLGGREDVIPHTEVTSDEGITYCSECRLQKYTQNSSRRMQSGGWNQNCVPRSGQATPQSQHVPLWRRLFGSSPNSVPPIAQVRQPSEQAQRAAEAAQRRSQLGDGASEGHV